MRSPPCNRNEALAASIVDQDFFFGNKLLHPRPAGFSKLAREKLVQAFANIFGSGKKCLGEVFH